MAAERLRTCGLFIALTVLALAAGAANGGISTVTYQVSADTDDGFAWSATDQNTTATYLRIGDGKLYDPPYYMSGMRFADVVVPRSAAITDARLRIRSMSDETGWQVYGVIEAEATDNAADFGSRYIGAAVRTATSVDWDQQFGWMDNTWQTSVDISAVVQEVTDRPGWNSGGAMAVFYSTRRRSGKSRKYASFAASPAYAPILEITYQTYAITGHVRSAEGAAIEGVVLSGGADIEDTTTDAGGHYELQVPPGWSGTVTVSKPDWGFDPPSRAYSSIAADQNDQDYAGIQPKISGYVTDAEGGVVGVTVSADNGGGSDTTDSAGYYEITVPYNWSGTVTPVKPGWNITPANWTYSNVVADQTNQNYTAFQPKVSGYVRDLGSAPIEGVLVSADSGGGSDTTDANGYYQFAVPYNWSGTVTPAKTGWGFTPANRAYSNVISNQSAQGYTGIQPRISGYVRDGAGSGISGVTVSADNGGGSAVTGGGGFYELVVPYGWSGTVTAEKAGWNITPESKSYTGVVNDQTGQNYTGWQPRVSGYVRDQYGNGLYWASVSADNGGGSAKTNSSGYYSIIVPYGWSGNVTASMDERQITPEYISLVNVVTDITDQDFVGYKPRVWGYVKDSSASGVEGVTAGGYYNGGTDVTDINGLYELHVPYNWTGEVRLTRSGWGIIPGSIFLTNIISDHLNPDATAYPPPKISGYVSDNDGVPSVGVALSADNGGGSALTDVNGFYELTVPYDWTGTITPSKFGWGFTPQNRNYTNVISNQDNENYTLVKLDTLTIECRLKQGDDGARAASSTHQSGPALAIGHEGGSTQEVPYMMSGMRFRDVMVPKGTEVVSGYLRIKTVNYGQGGTVYSELKAEYVDDAEDFSSHHMSSVPWTSTSVIWDIGTWNASTWYTSPDIASVIQEVIERPGWSMGNNLAILHCNRSNSSTIHYYLGYYTDPEVAPRLEISCRLPKTTISGYVRDSNGTPCSSVEMVADNFGGRTYTDANGYYQLQVPYNWSGSILPRRLYWEFTPSQRTYSEVVTDVNDQGYTGIAPPRIYGQIRDSSGRGIEGVTVDAGGGTALSISDSNGFYELEVPEGWSGTVAPTKVGWAFDPNQRVYDNLSTDQVNQDYTAFAPPVISGIITDTNGIPMEYVLVSAEPNGDSDTTDANGRYRLTVYQRWSGTVTPQKLFWFFEPANQTYSNLIADAANQDYVGTEGIRISGTVVNFGKVGIPGVEISADNGGSSDTTDAAGFYELAVPPAWSGTVTPNKPGRKFVPPMRSYSDLAANVTDQTFLSLTLTVRADGTGGFPTIQGAIDEALDGDVVIVHPGTYTGTGNKNLDFLGKSIVVRSVYPTDPCTVAATIIDCEGAGRGFYFHNYEQANSILDGLTIMNGSADYGAGIFCPDGDPTIRNCVITNNTAIREGGGIHCQWDGRPTITDCTISGNHAGDSGGGLAGCYAPVKSCVISDNSAYIGGGAWACYELNNCIITGNRAGSGGGVAGCEQLNSCLVVGNSAWQDGGGMYFCEYWPQITNCTIAWNHAVSGLGGGISFACSYTNGCVSNSVIWGNRDSNSTVALAQIYYGDYVPEVSFSCIQDDDADDANIPFGGADSNNIDDYPMFVRDANDGGDGWGDDPCTLGVDEGANDDFGDLHLLTGSPCINVGNPFSWIGPEGVDIDGQPRLMGGTIDMGADEFPYPRLVVTKPAGGEVWVSESSHQVTWFSEIYEGPVDILFSSNGGADWDTVETGADNSGTHPWHLPAVDSNQCVIAVVPSVLDPNVNTTESGLFTIHPDSPGPPVTSKWESLGGHYDRKGQSENYGPLLGCVKWEFEVDGAISAGVTIGPNDTVYVPCEDGNLYKLDSNGAVLWSCEANSPLISSPSIGPDGTAYVGSRNGKLFAVDIDGNVRWTHTAGGMVYSSPAVSVDGNSIYVGSQDGKVYALGRDGSELWSFETAGFGVVEASVFASPAVGADGTVYISGFYDANLYALDPNDGSVKWVCNFEHLIYPPEPEMGTEYGWPFASPVVGPDGTIYQVLLYDPNLYAIDPNDGSILWGTSLSDIVWDTDPYDDPTYSHTRYFEPYYYEDVYYDRRLDAFRYYNARYNVSSSGWSEPVIGPDGTIYVNFDDPWLRAVEPNGAIKWMRQIGAKSGYTETCGDWGCGWYSNGYGTMGFSLTVDRDGVIYAASNDSNLYVVSPDGFEIARYDSNDYWLGFPVVSADNTIIFGDSRDNTMLISYENNKLWAIGGDDCQGQDPNLYWQGGAQDLDNSGMMDFRDLAILAQYWHQCTGSPIYCYPCRRCYGDGHFLPGDVNKDFRVNFGDVAILAEYWLWGY